MPSPLRCLFDYLPPEDDSGALEPGVRVLVPFGNRRLIGILVDCADQTTIDPGRLKSALRILDDAPLFPPAMFRTLCWAAAYYQHPVGEVFSAALPNRLRSERPVAVVDEVWRPASPVTEQQLVSLKRAKKQQALLSLLRDGGELAAGQIKAAGYSPAVLRGLAEKGLIEKRLRPGSRGRPFDAGDVLAANTLELNEEQRDALQKIDSKMAGFACFLLDGVTGSGKTEVYMRLMQRQLSQARQCLMLVPEIGLTPQTVNRLRQRFKCPVAALHSGLSDGERLKAWKQARDGSAGIIIGTRSAVFTPLANPGVFIVDEEHDISFKQQDGFRYSARDLAVMRAREENVPIILGSATPSLESLHNAARHRFDYLRLTRRAGGAQPAPMTIIDIAETPLESGFSERLLFSIERHLKGGNQVLVFLNRRGFAPVLSCQDCGWVAECDNCIAQLTVHSRPPSLRCHHCGTNRHLPAHCCGCRSPNLSTLGIGTQQIEQFLNARFPDTAILRIDRDSTRSRRHLEQMLAQIEAGEPGILLGTQMLAKGHHFANITLAAILNADAGLFSADFRGQEHMVQTILQVAGRAGRAERAGEVLIQSRHGAHATLQSLTQGSYAGIAGMLLSERQASAMPPFSHLVMLRAEGTQPEPTLDFLRRVNSVAQQLCADTPLPIERIGPLPAPMEKRAGRFRVQLLLKSQSRAALQEFLPRLCQQLDTMKAPNNLRWSVDVDPQDLI